MASNVHGIAIWNIIKPNHVKKQKEKKKNSGEFPPITSNYKYSGMQSPNTTISHELHLNGKWSQLNIMNKFQNAGIRIKADRRCPSLNNGQISKLKHFLIGRLRLQTAGWAENDDFIPVTNGNPVGSEVKIPTGGGISILFKLVQRPRVHLEVCGDWDLFFFFIRKWLRRQVLLITRSSSKIMPLNYLQLFRRMKSHRRLMLCQNRDWMVVYRLG